MKAIDNLDIETLKKIAEDFYKSKIKRIGELILIINKQKKDEEYYTALANIGEQNEELKKYNLGLKFEENIIKHYDDAQKGKLKESQLEKDTRELLK